MGFIYIIIQGIAVAKSRFESLVVCLIRGSGPLALLHVHELAHGGSPSSYWILRCVLAKYNMTLRARMIDFLHAVHAKRDKTARPTSNKAKNHCK